MRAAHSALGGLTAGDAGRAGRARGWLRRVAGVVRTVVGAPDYERYVAHMRDRHPGCELASQAEFVRQRMESRYSKPGGRCC